jgi:large subunit ribosomal protein L13
MHQTYMDTVKSASGNRKWYIIDATDLVLGRMSTVVATVLKGKQKPTYTPHIDGGDYVIVINAEKIALTGNKWEEKKYYRASQYPGNLKTRTAAEQLVKSPEKIVEFAVRGMLPKGPQGDNMYRRLYVYVGPDYDQKAQKPEAFPLQVK